MAVCIRDLQIALHIDAGYGLVKWGVWVSRLRLSKPYETYVDSFRKIAIYSLHAALYIYTEQVMNYRCQDT